MATEGQQYCNNCVAGKYQNELQQTTCKVCSAGTSSGAVASGCTACAAGKTSLEGGSCENCPFNTFALSGDAACASCAVGKYAARGASSCSSCQTGQYMNGNYTMLRNEATTALIPCFACAPCAAGAQRVQCYANSSSPGACVSCPGGQRLVAATGKCEPCPENEYYDASNGTRVDLTVCSKCPRNSISAPGSKSLQECLCTAGFIAVYTEKTSFKCGCEFGRYVSGTKCEECEDCARGYYRTECEFESPGTCVKCGKTCGPGEVLAGCGGLHEGTCKRTTDLVRTPLCPENPGGFGFYDFDSVFRANKRELDFRCSDVCDGRTIYDTVECDGPYACNMATCAEDVSEEGNMIPVRACPVVITNTDDEGTRQRKRSEKCVPCKRCGLSGYSTGSQKYGDWGAGCVRECSQLLCSQGMVWDWTSGRCSACDALRDIRLCSKSDSLSLAQRTVSGNLPLLFFPDCKAGGRNLLQIGYGKCKQCDEASRQRCAGQTYPANCQDGATVLCKECSRTTQALYVDVVQGRWLKEGVWEPLHCQLSACKERNGKQWTGVDSSGRLCRRACVQIACAVDEILVPCRLPHPARCVKVFPAAESVPPTMRSNTLYAGSEVNLLEDGSGRAVASFENIFMVLPSNSEYQCVWNADGIIDNTATPGGLSHVLWAPGQTADDQFRERGTRACRIWDVAGNVDMPLLPLQNTVSCSDLEDSTSKCLESIILVNTEAYAMSYSFSGDFGVVGPDPPKINVMFMAPGGERGERMLSGVHVGGEGYLFLMLRMHQRTARLAATVPNGRALYSASWVQALLVSFAVADVTEYTELGAHANVRVAAFLTVNEQIVSDEGSQYVPELFWVQALAGQDAAASSLFSVQRNGFADGTPCDSRDQVAPLAQLDLAPWREEHVEHVWVLESNGSAMLFDVSVACEINGVSAECSDLYNVGEVFVLSAPYVPCAACRACPECDSCGPPLCSPTEDKTLLGLRKLREHILDTPRADRLTQGSAARVEHKLQRSEGAPVHIQQAHAVSAYGQCAVLLTSSVLDTAYSTSQSITCVGADSVRALREAIQGSKYRGAYSAVVAGRPVFLMLLGSLEVLFSSLQWQNMTEASMLLQNTTEMQQPQLVLGSGTSTWLTAAVHADNVTALFVDEQTDSLVLGFFRLQWVSLWELGLTKVAEQSLGDDWKMTINPWLDFARVVVSAETPYALMAWVETHVSETLQATVLLLRTCACSPGDAAVCASIALHELSPASNASFVSAALLRRTDEEHEWAVSVHGKTHLAVLSAGALRLLQVFSTDVDSKYFVKVQDVFYCFSIDESGAAVQPSVLTYLPHFQRWGSLSYASLPAVYAVLVVPPSTNSSLRTAEFAFTEEIQEEAGNASSVQLTTVVRKTLQLRVWRTSYTVRKPGEPAAPLYERVSEAPEGDHTTQILVSSHVVSARAQAASALFPSYSRTSNNLTVNRALGLPSAFGRYERVGSTCMFLEHATGLPPVLPAPPECIEQLYLSFNIAGALCPDDGDIDGLYTLLTRDEAAAAQLSAEYDMLSEKPVYARRRSWASSELSSIHRYIYYARNSGWVVSGVLGFQWSAACQSVVSSNTWSSSRPSLASECGYIKALWTGGINNTRPPDTEAIEICKKESNLVLDNEKTGKLWAAYEAAKTAVQVTVRPRCCAAGQYSADGECMACAAGTFSHANWNTCLACLQGKYAASPGSTTCLACAPGTHAVSQASTACTECVAGTLCAAALQTPALTLMLTRDTVLAEWLQLVFTVPCDARVQLFQQQAGVCDLAATAAAASICPDGGRVVILLHARRTEASSVHVIVNGALRSTYSAHSDCIYMQQGVLWVDATLLQRAPRPREIETVLEKVGSSSGRLTALAPLPPPGSWRRQRHVLTGAPRQDMRVELVLQRDAVPLTVEVAVGLDDLQLTPVLSRVPAVLHGASLCTAVHVPSLQELATVGLQHLLLGNASLDDWERLHVTVALSTSSAGCQYTASLFYTLDDGTCAANPEHSAEAHSLHRVGCFLTPSSEHVLGAYAECNIEAPAFLSSTLGVIVTPSAANSSCALDTSAELLVSMRAYTQFYSCPPAHYKAISGDCVSCVANTGFCALGSRLRGCPALEPAAAENCVPCAEGRELVASGAALYVRSEGEYCSWECMPGYFAFQLLGARTCSLCAQPPVGGCAAGTVWRECSRAHDAGCVPCPDLRLSAGPYAVNEEFLPIVNRSNTCQTQCKAGSYRSFDGFCKRCWGRAQLLVHAGPGFFSFEPCSQTSNSRARPCVARQGELIVASDTGEGTEENPFTGECTHICLPGWFAQDSACVPCASPPLVVAGVSTQHALPTSAFTWTANASSPCDFACTPPYSRTPVDAAVDTCVLCSGVCEQGSYPAGPYCKCARCMM